MKIEIKKLKEEEAEEKIDINIKVWWTTYRGLIPDEIIAKLQTKTKERIERQKQTIREKNRRKKIGDKKCNVLMIFISHQMILKY